ncbi:MAG TPA: dynamin family protein, partial [Bryobacteraceae bacterium]|nr:dynamin family protein [Bryobacteraceae bacterium]
MILETQEDYPEVKVPGPVELVNELAQRYQISALSGLLATTRAAVEQSEIPVAVMGRFKAGKSSFLNDLIGREILPAGVIPVTSVVTEIGYGPRESATVHFREAA